MPQRNIGESKVVRINTSPPRTRPTKWDKLKAKEKELETKEKSLHAYKQLLDRRLATESKSRKELKQERAKHEEEVKEFQKEKERFRNCNKLPKRVTALTMAQTNSSIQETISQHPDFILHQDLIQSIMNVLALEIDDYSDVVNSIWHHLQKCFNLLQNNGESQEIQSHHRLIEHARVLLEPKLNILQLTLDRISQHSSKPEMMEYELSILIMIEQDIIEMYKFATSEQQMLVQEKENQIAKAAKEKTEKKENEKLSKLISQNTELSILQLFELMILSMKYKVSCIDCQLTKKYLNLFMIFMKYGIILNSNYSMKSLPKDRVQIKHELNIAHLKETNCTIIKYEIGRKQSSNYYSVFTTSLTSFATAHVNDYHVYLLFYANSCMNVMYINDYYDAATGTISNYGNQLNGVSAHCVLATNIKWVERDITYYKCYKQWMERKLGTASKNITKAKTTITQVTKPSVRDPNDLPRPITIDLTSSRSTEPSIQCFTNQTTTNSASKSNETMASNPISIPMSSSNINEAYRMNTDHIIPTHGPYLSPQPMFDFNDLLSSPHRPTIINASSMMDNTSQPILNPSQFHPQRQRSLILSEEEKNREQPPTKKRKLDHQPRCFSSPTPMRRRVKRHDKQQMNVKYGYESNYGRRRDRERYYRSRGINPDRDRNSYYDEERDNRNHRKSGPRSNSRERRYDRRGSRERHTSRSRSRSPYRGYRYRR